MKVSLNIQEYAESLNPENKDLPILFETESGQIFGWFTTHVETINDIETLVIELCELKVEKRKRK